MSPQTFIFLGPSGSGKGTQSRLLGEYLALHSPDTAIHRLDMGNFFRQFWKKEGYTYDVSRAVMEAGDLQPAFLQVYLWGNFLVDEAQEVDHIIIDGAPRRLTDAVIMDGAFKFYRRNKPFFVFLNISKGEARRRLMERAHLKTGRKEDIDPRLVEARLAWYEDEVLPAINFFRNNPDYHFLEINGERDIEVVHADILAQFTHYVTN